MKMQNLLENSTRRYGSKVALSDGTAQLTYAQLNDAVTAHVRRLQQAGCTRLAIQGDNSTQWVLWDLAALCLGIPCTPLPPFFSAAQSNHALQSAGGQPHCRG